jgi:hypothetical protein
MVHVIHKGGDDTGKNGSMILWRHYISRFTKKCDNHGRGGGPTCYTIQTVLLIFKCLTDFDFFEIWKRKYIFSCAVCFPYLINPLEFHGIIIDLLHRIDRIKQL